MTPTPPTPGEVRQLLIKLFSLPPGELTDDGPLFSVGRLDSFHLVEMLNGLEQSFAVKISPGEVSLENFDTPRRIADFVGRKRGQPTQ